MTIRHTDKADYLGDGVYADMDGQMVRLTTENGVEATNEIFLEPEIVLALVRYAERHGIVKLNQPK